MSELQPIETAPKDGSEVDAYDADGPLGIAHFHCNEWLVWGGDPEIGWERIIPSRWMPLPDPSEQSETCKTTVKRDEKSQ